MSLGTTLIVLTGVLVFSRLVDPLLDSMHISRRAAWGILGLLLAGALLPIFRIAGVRLNPGAVLFPLCVCAVLLMGVTTSRRRAIVLLTAAGISVAMFAFTILVPGALEGVAAARDPFLGVVCGLLSAVLLRRPRAAAAAGIPAVILLDLYTSIRNYVRGEDTLFLLGHTGLMDGVMTALLVSMTAGYLLQSAVDACARRFGHGTT